ncbi:hypothetical protein [Planobispora rosea]
MAATGSASSALPPPDPGTVVLVHVNLHKGTFSVSDPRTRRVLHNATTVTLEAVTFIIHESTRQRVLRDRRRQVHAWAKGTLVTVDADPAPDVSGMVPVRYNPYRGGHFTADGRPLAGAQRITFRDRLGYLEAADARFQD